jgi:hypothetical protein
VSEADVAAALGWTRRTARATLEELGDRRTATPREEDGYRIWVPT